MAILFATGFELGNQTLYERLGIYFFNCVLSTNASFQHRMNGLGGNYSVKATGSVSTPILDTSARWLGFWARSESPTGAVNGIGFNRLGLNQFSVVIRVDGYIELRRGSTSGTLVATSASAIDQSVGHWIEVNLVAADSGGVCSVYIDNGVSTFVTYSGDTRASTTSDDWDQVEVNLGSVSVIYDDDLIITDATTGRPGEWCGVLFVANGNYAAGFTPSSGTNWENAGQTPTDSPTNYNQATATSVEDLYHLSNPLAASSIKCVVVHAVTVQGDATLAAQLAVRSGGTTGYSATKYPVASGPYGVLTGTWETNPSTSLAWQPSALRNLVAGLKTV